MRHVVLRRVALLIAAGLFAGCATAAPYRAHPQFQERVGGLKSVALMPPDVKVYELSAGGVRELMDEWSATARTNVVSAITKQMAAGIGLTFREFDLEAAPAAQQEFDEVRPLFEALSASVITHTYRPETTFETKRGHFDYSLGPMPALGQAAEADAVLFVYALDHVSSGGRVALNIFMVLLGAAAGAAVIPAGGTTVLVTALADTGTGDVLWFNAKSSGGGHDLRDPASATSLVADAFAELRKATAARTPRVPKRE